MSKLLSAACSFALTDASFLSNFRGYCMMLGSENAMADEAACSLSLNSSVVKDQTKASASRGLQIDKQAALRNGADKPCLPPLTLAFVYGTLKKGFGNFWLMEELILNGHAFFVGIAETKQRFPLVCGPFQVPFLLNMPSDGHHVVGEVYLVDRIALARLDELEGVDKGHYERSRLAVCCRSLDSVAREMVDDVCQAGDGREMNVEAYFAASHYARRLAQAPHLKAYTEKEAATYTRRKDRPQNYTFLQHVQAWIDEQGLINVET